MTEEARPDPALHQAGLSATGKTADELQVGQSRVGTSYDHSAGRVRPTARRYWETRQPISGSPRSLRMVTGRRT